MLMLMMKRSADEHVAVVLWRARSGPVAELLVPWVLHVRLPALSIVVQRDTVHALASVCGSITELDVETFSLSNQSGYRLTGACLHGNERNRQTQQAHVLIRKYR